jgi:adenylosuccinate synthase
LTIDREALVTTPYHQALNRLREIARGAERHGSCGLGIGETMADALALGERVPQMGDLHDPIGLKQKLLTLREWKLAQLRAIHDELSDTEIVRRERAVIEDTHFLDFLVDAYRRFAGQVAIVEPSFLAELLTEGIVIAEGAQGVLLDEWYGFHPYTTWSTTTFQNADTLLQEQCYDGHVVHLGALRAYATRHGPGPFVTEDAVLAGVLPEMHNVPNAWQLAMRIGHFDAVATRYALAVTGPVDLLAITHVDRLHELKEWKIATSYEYRSHSTDLADCFVMHGKALSDIRVSKRPDLVYQEQLTQHLQQCAPHYQLQHTRNSTPATDSDISSYLAQIESEVNVPIGIVSAGPTAIDKRFTPSWIQHVRSMIEKQVRL